MIRNILLWLALIVGVLSLAICAAAVALSIGAVGGIQ